MATYIHGVNLEVMTAAYIECALWACTIPADDNGTPVEPNEDGEYPEGTREDMPCDQVTADLSPEARAEALEDCRSFLEYAGEEYGEDVFAGLDDSQIGHDFHLSRNRHGAGFWDRGLGEQGDDLHRAATTFGTHGIMAQDAETLVFHG